jgi:hypothetical protein
MPERDRDGTSVESATVGLSNQGFFELITVTVTSE